MHNAKPYVNFERGQGEPFADWFERRLRALAHRPFGVIDPAHTPPSFKYAAVLAPFWRQGDAVHVVLTKRLGTLSSHKGQISFPGGRRDHADPDELSTALRETEEELGIGPESVEFTARLDDSWSIQHYVVAPFAAWLPQPVTLQPSPHEIERVIVADVETLMLPESHSRQTLNRDGQTIDVHYFDYRGDVIWGLTGGLLHALFEFVRGRELNERERGPATFRQFIGGER